MNKLRYKELIKKYDKKRKVFENISIDNYINDIQISLTLNHLSLDDIPDDFSPFEEELLLNEIDKIQNKEKYRVKIQNAIEKADEKIHLANTTLFFKTRGYRQALKILEDAEKYLPNGACYQMILEKINQIAILRGCLYAQL